MSLLKDFAIKAFLDGSDNFGEHVTGEVGDLIMLSRKIITQ